MQKVEAGAEGTEGEAKAELKIADADKKERQKQKRNKRHLLKKNNQKK